MVDRVLNADPSSPDQRDFPFTADTAVPLERRFLVTGLGPLLDQGSTGTCVAHTGAGVRHWQEKRDGHGVIPIDVLELYDLCKSIDGVADPARRLGTTLRTLLRVLKGSGTPLRGGGRAGRIAVYWRVTVSTSEIKRALLARGPLAARLDWDANWMRLPPNRVLRGPAGVTVGGHAFLLIGWDDDVNGGAWIIRNSWGRWSQGGNGNAYLAYRHTTGRRLEVWASTDVDD